MELLNVMIGLIFILGPFDGVAHAASYAEELQRLTGLRPGVYELAPNQNPECPSGELQIIDAGPQVASILIETNEIIDLIGPNSDSRANRKGEGGCTYSRPYVEGSVRSGHLDGVKTLRCKHVTDRWVYSIDVTKNGFTYTINRHGNDETCSLVATGAP